MTNVASKGSVLKKVVTLSTMNEMSFQKDTDPDSPTAMTQMHSSPGRPQRRRDQQFE